MSLLLISQVIGLLLNTLTADEKYSFCISVNLLSPIQMQLSKMQKTFSQLSALFLKCT